MNFCPNCGRKLIGNEKFCTKCGIPIYPNQKILRNREKYTITKDPSSNKHVIYLKDFSVKAGIEALAEINRKVSKDLREYSKEALGISGFELDENEEEYNSIESDRLWFSDGLILFRHFPNRQDDALECFEKALRLNSDHAEAWLYKGQIYLKKGKLIGTRHFNLNYLEQALECFNKIFDIKLEYEVEQQTIIDALLGKSITFTGMRRYKDALDCVDKVLDLDPNNPHAQNQEKYLHSRLTPRQDYHAKYDEIPIQLPFIAYIDKIRVLRRDLLKENFMMGIEGAPMTDWKDILIAKSKKNLVQNLPIKSEDLISFIKNISDVEGCYRFIDLVGKQFSIQYNKDRIEEIELETLLMEEGDNSVQLFPYDEIIIYLSEEFSKKDTPPKQLYIKHTGGIDLLDIENALDLLPHYGWKDEHPCYGVLEYYYDYEEIPVYFCFVVFKKYYRDNDIFRTHFIAER